MNSLNPCFSGGWSRSWGWIPKTLPPLGSLNPCFSGGWSRRIWMRTIPNEVAAVLILVLVEDGLGG